jgi:hypothetical protein
MQQAGSRAAMYVITISKGGGVVQDLALESAVEPYVLGVGGACLRIGKPDSNNENSTSFEV